MPKRLEERSIAELVDEIKGLRQENGDRRTALAKYETLFSGLPPEMSEAFLRIVNVYNGDRVAGAELMQDLSKSVLEANGGGETESQPPEGNEEDMTDTSDSGGDLAKILELLEKQEERIGSLETERKETMQVLQDRERADAVAYLGELGYKEGGPEWDAIVRIAQNEISGYDLDEADKIYRAVHGVPSGAKDAEGEGEGDDKTKTNGKGAADKPAEDDGKPKFPATSGGSHGVPGAGSGESKEEEDLSLSAVEGRVREYLESVAEATPG